MRQMNTCAIFYIHYIILLISVLWTQVIIFSFKTLKKFLVCNCFETIKLMRFPCLCWKSVFWFFYKFENNKQKEKQKYLVETKFSNFNRKIKFFRLLVRKKVFHLTFSTKKISKDGNFQKVATFSGNERNIWGKRLCFAKTVFFVIKSDFREYKNGLVLNSSQVVKTIENVFAETSLENNNLLENKTSWSSWTTKTTWISDEFIITQLIYLDKITSETYQMWYNLWQTYLVLRFKYNWMKTNKRIDGGKFIIEMVCLMQTRK